MGLLASHLLETPSGERAQNVDQAAALYREVLHHAGSDRTSDGWLVGTSGLANSLVTHPSPTQADLIAAAELFDEVIAETRSRGDPRLLAIVLGQRARLHAAARAGDVDAELERAILLLEEAVDVLEALPPPGEGAQLGRALHNLGGLLLQRRTGVRADNVDRAIQALEAALEHRPSDVDPVGRARTLRALAIAYPGWSATGSLEEAEYLAASATAEAEQLEESDPRAAGRASGWAAFARQRSALTADLEPMYGWPNEQQLAWLDAAITNHLQALDAIAPDSLPWADWMGGLGRLLGRLPHLGVTDQLESAYSCFGQALEFADPVNHPRLRRELLIRWGELGHEIGDFETSFRTYGEAAELSAVLFAAIADPEHQWAELEATRANSLFAAYAAVRLGRPADAARLAELGKARSLADLMVAAAAGAAAPEAKRREIQAALDTVHRLESELRNLRQDDLATIQRRLADYVGAPPELIQMRSLKEGGEDGGRAAAQLDEVRSQLAETRRHLRALVVGTAPTPTGFAADELAALARKSGRALVYLMATVHGSAAVIITPDGGYHSATFDGLGSGGARALLYGTEEEDGFVDTLRGDDKELEDVLDNVEWTLGPALMAPLSQWLEARGVESAVLMPLGTLGLLPLHVAAGDSVTFSYAPCARALALAGAAPARAEWGDTLVVASPTSDDKDPLPYAVAEGRAIAALLGYAAPVRICVAGDAELARVSEGMAKAPVIHLACHGEFRPADPLESHLLLAGDDRLTLADIYTRRASVAGARLVTLASCRSGTVEFQRAPDESLGFPAALMVAGVPSIVSTMWPVDDSAAMFFGLRFYEVLTAEAVDPAQAVSRARSWLRSATAAELRGRIAGLRATLQDGDDLARAALAELEAEPAFADDRAMPYSNIQDWGAFIATGR